MFFRKIVIYRNVENNKNLWTVATDFNLREKQRMFFVQVRELCGKFEGTFLKIWYFVPFLRIFTNFYIVFALKWRVSAIFIPCHFTILREKLQTKMHKYTKNAGIVLFYTQNPAYLAAPVRLELTTHGLTVRCSTDWAKGQ